MAAHVHKKNTALFPSTLIKSVISHYNISPDIMDISLLSLRITLFIPKLKSNAAENGWSSAIIRLKAYAHFELPAKASLFVCIKID